MAVQNIRWVQRLSNYKRACKQLVAAVELSAARELSELERQGLIQAFEFVFELAWNVMKDYFIDQGNADITGSRDAIRHAFKQGLVTDGEGWMEMIKSRNQSSHTYNEAVARAISDKVVERYCDLFVTFEVEMQARVERLND